MVVSPARVVSQSLYIKLANNSKVAELITSLNYKELMAAFADAR